MSSTVAVMVSSLKFTPAPGTWVVVAQVLGDEKKYPLFQKVAPGLEVKVGDPVCGADDEQMIAGCGSGYYNEVTHIIEDKLTVELLESVYQLSRLNYHNEGHSESDPGKLWTNFQELFRTLVKDYRVIPNEVKDFSDEI